MQWWRHISPVVRRFVALAVLAVLTDATTLRADDIECEAVDSDGVPRDCTFSERLGKCGYEAWDSWKQCVDTNGDGFQDVDGIDKAYCDFWGAVDLLACGLTVPWDIILGKD